MYAATKCHKRSGETFINQNTINFSSKNTEKKFDHRKTSEETKGISSLHNVSTLKLLVQISNEIPRVFSALLSHLPSVDGTLMTCNNNNVYPFNRISRIGTVATH